MSPVRGQEKSMCFLPQGPSAREERRDKTAFEEARETWGRSTVSARGKVGTGDHKNEVWLG